MRKASDLTRDQLEAIVEAVQECLYLDDDEAGHTYWNPQKQWQGADICEHLANELGNHGLIPATPMKAGAQQQANDHNLKPPEQPNS